MSDTQNLCVWQLVFWLLVVSSFNYFKMHACSYHLQAFFFKYLTVAACMLSVMKMLLKEEVGGHALNSHGNYIVDHGKSLKNHRIVVLNFCWNPEWGCLSIESQPQNHEFRNVVCLHRESTSKCWIRQIMIVIPPANFVCGGYTVLALSLCACVRPSVTFWFLTILKSHCWTFIKPCKHVYICKTNTLDKKVRARGQFY